MRITNKSKKFEAIVNTAEELAEVLRIPESSYRVSKVFIKEPYKRYHVVEEFFQTLQGIEHLSQYGLNLRYRKFLKETKGYKNTGTKRSIDFWLFKGYTEQEAREEISKIQREYTAKNPRENGTVRMMSYWIKKGFSEEEAKQKVADVQRRDLTHFKKQGISEEEAIERMKLRNERWLDSLNETLKYDNFHERKGRTFEQMVEKYGEAKARDIIERRTSNNFGGVFNGTSGIEALIYEEYLEMHGFQRWLKLVSNVKWGHFIYDYYHEELKIVVEFNGDFWHCNPDLYDKDYMHPVMNKTAEEIWKKDERKKEIAESNGYKFYTIWESDVIRKTVYAILEENGIILDQKP